jgi:hypothetical protein
MGVRPGRRRGRSDGCLTRGRKPKVADAEIGAGHCRSQRDRSRHDSPAVGGDVDPKLAIEDGETVVEPHDAASMRLGAADAVVAHVDVKRAASTRALTSARCARECFATFVDRGVGHAGHGRRAQGIQLPESIKRAMARQAGAEREKRAKIIAAEGEALAAGELADAADVMKAHRPRVAPRSSRPSFRSLRTNPARRVGLVSGRSVLDNCRRCGGPRQQRWTTVRLGPPPDHAGLRPGMDRAIVDCS